MKIKFLTTLFTLFLATSSFAATANSAHQKAESKDSIHYNSTRSIIDVKTFDFERIFKEADAYFDAAQKWKTVKCIPQSMFVCSKHECPKLKLTESSAIIVDKENKTLALCRNKICQYYNAEFEQTGVFINVRVKDVNGIAIRILGDSRFKEIAIVGLDAYITNGECVVLK